MTVYAGALNSATDLGGRQLGYLEELLDEPTTRFISAVTARPGQRCLDLGAGSGSITRWFAERTGPTGHVVAVDIEDTHLDVPPGVAVHRHDIHDGVPPGGPFDVIHSRLLLIHLERRREILAQLVDALAPGGWLIIGEFARPSMDPIASPSDADSLLFRRVVETALDEVARPAGMSLEWGDEMDGAVRAAGLSTVDSMRLTTTFAGGTTGGLLYSNYIEQGDAPLRAVGITGDELARFHELMRDPRFRGWFFPFLCTRARKPDTA